MLLGTLTVVEAVTALFTGSLALLSDAGHMFTDVLGISMALAAITAATRAAQPDRTDPQRTFGLYRLEVLAALANAVLLSGVAVYVLVAAVRRLDDPPEIVVGPMLAVAAAGLVANVVAFLLLRPGAKESLNVRGAYLEVRGRPARLGRRAGRRRGHRARPAGGTRTRWSRSRSACSSCRAPGGWPARRCASWCRPRPEHVDVTAVRATLAGGARRTRRARPARLDARLGDGRHVGAPHPGRARRRRRGARRGAA